MVAPSAPFRLGRAALLALGVAALALAAPEARAQAERAEAERPAPADTIRTAPLFDARVAAGHKPRRRGERPARRGPRPAPSAAPPSAPERAAAEAPRRRPTTAAGGAPQAPTAVQAPRRDLGTYRAAPLTASGARPRASQPAGRRTEGPPAAPRPEEARPPSPTYAPASLAVERPAPPPPAAAPAADPTPEASGAAPRPGGAPARPSFFDTRVASGHMEGASPASDGLFDTRVAEGHKDLPLPEPTVSGPFGVPEGALRLVDAQRGVVARRFSATSRRQRQYFPHIERTLLAYGLPSELKYVALIESGLDPQAVSHAGARGLWQIMPETAGDFGLDSMSVHTPTVATRTAAMYFGRLEKMFDGDWLLVLAAYNGGPGRVRSAVRAYERQHGRTPTFWDIRGRLPRETQEYVPRFLAAVEHFEADA